MINMNTEKVFFDTTDNLKLCGLLHSQVRKSDKCIVLCHGITVDKRETGIFDELSEVLFKGGFDIFRFDFRGSGESEGDSRDMTIRREIDDLKSTKIYLDALGYKEYALLGASFGGSIATFYTEENPENIRCLCLWNPVLNYEHSFPKPTLPWLKDEIHVLKRDMEDKGWAEIGKRKFKIGVELFKEMMTLYPFKSLHNLILPIIVVHGDKDSYIPFEDSKEYSKNMVNCKFIAITGAEHGFHNKQEISHDVYTLTLKFFLQNFKG